MLEGLCSSSGEVVGEAHCALSCGMPMFFRSAGKRADVFLLVTRAIREYAASTYPPRP